VTTQAIYPMQKYVFSIIQSKKEVNFGPIGFGDQEVYTIHFKDIAAVVCDMDKDSLSIFKEGLTHQKVNEAVMRRFTPIPMSFGMTPRDENDIKGFLAKYHADLKKLFMRIDEKIEAGLTAYLTEKYIDEKMSEFRNLGQIKTLIERIKKNPKQAYYLKIEVGKLVADRISREGERIANEIYGILSPLTVETRKNEITSNRMILNAAFLLEREREEEFDQHVDLIDKRFKDQIRLRYISPCPPYNFVKMEV